MQEENTALSIVLAVPCSPCWRDAEEITPESLSPRKRHSATSAWTAEKCRSRRGIFPSTLNTKCPLFFSQARVVVPMRAQERGKDPSAQGWVSQISLLWLRALLLMCGCDLLWGLWVAAALQSLGTQGVWRCQGIPCSGSSHKVTEQSTGVGLPSLGLLVSCKITTWVHLETTAGLQTLSLNRQQQHQICSLKTLSLCWVSAQGRHSKHVNDFGQHVALTVIAFTVILETLKWLQQIHFVVHPGTVVLPFIIYLYLALFHIFLCFNVCFIFVSEGLFLVLEGTRLLIWPQARCFLSISIINKSRIKKS